MAKKTLKAKMLARIKRSKEPVFMRMDFKDLGGYDQVGRVLKQLSDEEFLLRIGYGVYAIAKRSPLTNSLITSIGMPDAAQIFLKKIGKEPALSSAEQAYINGSTQVPVGRVIGVKGEVKRKLFCNGRTFRFENVA